MKETFCSCCKILGKPPHPINFIVTTGLPNSLVYEQIKHLLLTNISASQPPTDDGCLSDYQGLVEIDNSLFDSRNHLPSIHQVLSTPVGNCCNGLRILSFGMDDKSKSLNADEIEKTIKTLLDSSAEEQIKKHQSPSWILLCGSIFLEPTLISTFLPNKSSYMVSADYTVTLICFLGNEKRLFETWLCQLTSFENYDQNVYPDYNKKIKNFFAFLNTSEYLRSNTLLIDEQTALNDKELRNILEAIYHVKPMNYRATDDGLRSKMERLLSPKVRTIHEILHTRSSLVKVYREKISKRLEALFYSMQRAETADHAVREICHIILNVLPRLDKEQQSIYRKLFMTDFRNSREQLSTIASQMTHYALTLIENNNSKLIPLLYGIAEAICRLIDHYYLCHGLLRKTPEIYKLSLLLITQRQYALTLVGTKLCARILEKDVKEHKYGDTYLAYDLHTTRRILDAIKWLLSPYQKLKEFWQNEKKQFNLQMPTQVPEDNSFEFTSEASISRDFSILCSRHASTLHEHCQIWRIATLFAGSAEHRLQVTKEDVHYLADVVHVLSNIHMVYRMEDEVNYDPCILLMSDLCSLLMAILLYGLPETTSVLLNETHLLISIPKGIDCLLKIQGIDERIINRVTTFYIQFTQSKYKQIRSESESRWQEKVKTNDLQVFEDDTNSFGPLSLSEDLISSYFDLYRKVRHPSLVKDNSWKQKELQALLDEEWKKLNIIQLQYECERLKDERKLLRDELAKLKDELQRTHSDRNQIREENLRLSQEINHFKHRSTINRTIDVTPMLITTSADNIPEHRIIDEIENLSPNEVTVQQAQRFIREINYRRTTFSDNDMRKSICGSLKNLGSDLYSSPVHFLNELIQNAEDNFYDNSVVPCLRIELDHSYVLLSNNERGLRAKDVSAICSLSVTTKSDLQDRIGEKGVGFKSVFSASDEPMLVSHSWKFRFSIKSTDAMSYITPLWVADEEIPDSILSHLSKYPRDTHLYLPLKFEVNSDEANELLDQTIRVIDPCILLNMHHLKTLEINDKRQNRITTIEKQYQGSTQLKEQLNVTFEGFTFLNLTGSVIQLRTSTECNTFRVYTCDINVLKSDERRPSSKTQLILSFPCDENCNLTNTVYAGLPVCSLGFNFLFNADFQLVTSREHVRENVPFNVSVRDHISALFVYILLNDSDIRKDINRYYRASYKHKLSSWWHIMIDNINSFIAKYLSVLLEIEAGKELRYLNKELSMLVLKEQLSDCANIHVIDLEDSFLTLEQLSSFRIQPVSIGDILQCFPDRNDNSFNDDCREQFRLWTQKKDEKWWSEFFHHLAQMMTPDICEKLLQKPIFLLQHDQPRQYLPKTDNDTLLLFISDDQLFQMWKRNIILLRYSSETEKNVLLKSTHVQRLTDEQMVDVIRLDHLQLALLFLNSTPSSHLIEEIWRDLLYLRLHLNKLDKSTPFVVPAHHSQTLIQIQQATLPSILGVDIQRFIDPLYNSPIIDFPYYECRRDQLFDILHWEHFFLEMNCQRPLILLSTNHPIATLPSLPSLERFSCEEITKVAEKIFCYQEEISKEFIRQLPIVDNEDQQICSVSMTFDEAIVRDLPSAPHITIPSHCRTLAKDLHVCVDYDCVTCFKVLEILSSQKCTNVDLYVKWLSYLQLYISQQQIDLNSEDLSSSFALFLPDQQSHCPVRKLVFISDDEERYRDILVISKYLEFQIISQTKNHLYWQLRDIFQRLGALSVSAICIIHVYDAIYQASLDKDNFLSLGDCTTILSDDGLKMLTNLYRYLEDLILQCVKNHSQESELYATIITDKHPTAPIGSPEDFRWRFSFTCNPLSQKLKEITGIVDQIKKIGLPTINRHIIIKGIENIVYGCFETEITFDLLKFSEKRHYILPRMTRECPLVLATFGIDYIERQCKIKWLHKSLNPEYSLPDLTTIFCEALNDPEIEVMKAMYTSTNVLFSDSLALNSATEQTDHESDVPWIDYAFPFWIFNKTVVLCTGTVKDSHAVKYSALFALTTLLHKRKHEPIDKAKSIALAYINNFSKFDSDTPSRVAGKGPDVYSFIEMIFPIEQDSTEKTFLLVERPYKNDQGPKGNRRHFVAPNRKSVDQMYRDRVKFLDHRNQGTTVPTIGKDVSLLDIIEKILIGENAEHFFFVYLQKLYGDYHVTPIGNWRSSFRRVTFPHVLDNIDDSVGFDFELHDRNEVFVSGSGSTTKYCRFEVKGTSGPFNVEQTRFHISRNELQICESIARNSEKGKEEAYFIVIIKHCLDPTKIDFGTIINWSENFTMVHAEPTNYVCHIVRPSENTSRTNNNRVIEPWRPRFRNKNSSAPFESENRSYRPSSRQDELSRPQESQRTYGNNTENTRYRSVKRP